MSSSDYAEKLKDPRWQKKRLEIFQRDNWTCKKCGEKTKTLHIHHLLYIPRVEPWDIPSGFLVTLCEDCHGAKKEDGCDQGVCRECEYFEPEYGRRGRPDDTPSQIPREIASLLDQIWTSGYSCDDLIFIQVERAE